MSIVPLGGALQSQQINLGSNVVMQNLSVNNLSVTHGTIDNLKTAIFSPNTLNTSVLNVSVINFPPDYVFPALTVTTLNSTNEFFVNTSIQNLSAQVITAGFLTAPNVQEKLIAGENINISGTTISASGSLIPSNAVFTSVNASVITANNISTGSLSFGTGLILENNQLRADSIATITQNSTKLVTSGAVFSAFQNNTNNNINFISHINESSSPYAIQTIRTTVAPSFELPFIKTFHKSKLGNNALISVSFQFNYSVGGTNGDNMTAIIKRISPSGTALEVCRIKQTWNNGSGGGTRSSAMSPITGTFISDYSLNAVFELQVVIRNDGSDDDFTFIPGTSGASRTTCIIIESLPQTSLTTLTADFITSNNALNGSELICQPNNANGKAFVGKCIIGNTTFNNMMSLSLPGNDNGTNYAFGQVENFETIVNCAVAGSGNSFRIRNVEGMRNTSVGLSISPGAGNRNPTQALDVVGNMVITGSITCDSINTTDESIINLSSQNISVNNITVNGIFEGVNFSTTNLIPGNNITIDASGVISSFFGTNSSIAVGNLYVDEEAYIFGALNVSETSRFQESLQVENQIILGKSGDREGHALFVSEHVGSNYTLRVRDTSIINNTTNLLDKYVFKVNNVSTLIIKENEVNISGALLASSGNFSTITLSNLTINQAVLTNISNTNLSSSSITSTLSNISTGNFSNISVNNVCARELYLSKGRKYIDFPIRDFSFGPAGGVYFLICRLGTSEAVKGTIHLEVITSTQYNAFSADIIISQRSGQSFTDKFSLNSTIVNDALTMGMRIVEYEGQDWWALNWRGSSNMTGQTGFFEGRNTETDPDAFKVVVASELDAISADLISDDAHTFFYQPVNVPLLITPSINTSNMSFTTINGSTINSTNANFSNINFSTLGTTSLNVSGTIRTFNLNISNANNSAEAATIKRSGALTDFTNASGDFRFFTKSNNATLIISRNDIVETRTLQNSGLMETNNFSTDNNISCAGSLSAVNTIQSAIGNFSTINLSSLTLSTLNISNLNVSSGTMRELTIFGDVTEAGVGLNVGPGAPANISLLNASEFTNTGKDSFFGSAIIPQDFTRFSMYSPAGEVGEIGLRFGLDPINASASIARLDLRTQFGNISTFNILSNNTSCLTIDNTSALFYNNVKISSGTIHSNNGNFSTLNFSNISGINASFTGSMSVSVGIFSTINSSFINGIVRSSTANISNLSSNTIRSFVYNISDALDDTEASVLIRNGNLTEFIHTGGVIKFSSNSINTSVCNFSTTNASRINCSNIVGTINSSLANISVLIGDAIDIVKIDFDNMSGINASFTGEMNVSTLTCHNLIPTNIRGLQAIQCVAMAKVAANGTAVRAINCSTSRTSTGRYRFTFNSSRPTNQYVMHVQVQENATDLDDIIATIDDGSETTSLFDYQIHEQDNSGTAGVPRDRIHYVSVFDVS